MIRSNHTRFALGVASVALPLLAFLSPTFTSPPFTSPTVVSVRGHDASNEATDLVGNRYVGAKACKNCHKAEHKGGQYQKWEKLAHAKAYEALASPEAKKVGAKLGVADPQKSDKCLKCHTTGHGLKPDQFKKGFKIEMGVQCEACHGPGEQHVKIRFKIATAGKTDPKVYVKIPDDEILKRPDGKTCLVCHSKKDSPTFKPFCFKARLEEISHPDPRIVLTPAEIEARKCQCGKDCKCEQGECGCDTTPKPSKESPAKEGPAKKGPAKEGPAKKQ